MAGWCSFEQVDQAGCMPRPDPRYGAVVKNTFLHVVGAEGNSSEDTVYCGSCRREKSEPAKLHRSLYESGGSTCSTMLGTQCSETTVEKADESDSSGHATWPSTHEADSESQRVQASSVQAVSRPGRERRSRNKDAVQDLVQWDDSIVAVMVRQIPRHYTQSMFLKLVNRKGFKGLFNFLYLLFDYKKGINVGYGFVNFVKPEYARAFHSAFNGVYVEKHYKMRSKPLYVHPALVQGYEANVKHFKQTKMGQTLDPVFSPLFFPEAGIASPAASKLTRAYASGKQILPSTKTSTTRSVNSSASTNAPMPSFPPGQWQVRSEALCPQCGEAYSPHHRFCMQCGLPLNGTTGSS
mmetsp:Transcript_66858/g.145815  ORF Transcript_66858/g.145815 Transcript_66858/m.145815 type:complete len:352 (-) Transcript_66858:241-1296(-)